MPIDDSSVTIEPSATEPGIQPPEDPSSTRLHVAHTTSPVLYTPTSTVANDTDDNPPLALGTIIGIASGTVFAFALTLALILLVVICMRRRRSKRGGAYGDRANVLRTQQHSDSFIPLTHLKKLGRVTLKPKNSSGYSSVHQRTSSPQSDTTSKELSAPTVDSVAGSPAPLERSIELWENPSYSVLSVASCEGTDSPDFEDHVYDVVRVPARALLSVVPVTAPAEYEMPRSLPQVDDEEYIYEDANTTYAEIL